MSERTILLLGSTFLGLVLLVAVFALRVGPQPTAPVSLEELPVTDPSPEEPTEAVCREAGGTVAYERTSTCFSEPNVHDVCEWGLPCIGSSSDGYRCVDMRRPICTCEDGGSCPEGFVCDKNFATPRCTRPPIPYYPKPIE